jgi:hypothetical protein
MCGTCAHGGDKEKHSKFLSSKLKGRDHLQNLSIDGRITLKFL